jgi:carbon dioxide concentrating mechanism protein CcmN
MSLPSLQLQPISTSHYYVSGDVTIQAGVAIAPGVLLQADPNSRVIIKAGACIGIGAVLHAHGGMVEVGEGANIGAEVLLVGQVTIGARACIGAATTILNSAIAKDEMVRPGSLIGDPHHAPESQVTEPQVTELQATDTIPLPGVDAAVKRESDLEPPNGALSTVDTNSVNVYGQMYVNQLLVKMFPGSRRFAEPTESKPRSSSEDPWDG